MNRLRDEAVRASRIALRAMQASKRQHGPDPSDPSIDEYPDLDALEDEGEFDLDWDRAVDIEPGPIPSILSTVMDRFRSRIATKPKRQTDIE